MSAISGAESTRAAWTEGGVPSRRTQRLRWFCGLVCLVLVGGTAPAATGTFGNPIAYRVDGGPVAVVVGDFDGKSGLDFVTVNATGSKGASLSVMVNAGAGRFFTERRVAIRGRDVILHAADVADVNRDGTLDLVIAMDDAGVAPPRGRVVLYVGHGDGTFVPSYGFLAQGVFPQCVAARDLNGDGMPDLIGCHSVIESAGGFLSVWPAELQKRKTGSGFAGRVPLRVGGQPATLAVGDLDGDGRQDAVVGDSLQERIYVLYGNAGAGLFDPPVVAARVDTPDKVVLADVNGDGLLDIVTMSKEAAVVRVLFQNTPRSFQPAARVVLPQSPADISVADFDGDGTPDFAVVVQDPQQLALWLGHGDGTFVPAESIALRSTPNAVVSGDFNGDARTDLVATSATSNTAMVFLNGVQVGVTACPATPRVGCTPADASSLRVRLARKPRGNRLTWLWQANGGSLQVPDPVAEPTLFALCLYDEKAGLPELALQATTRDFNCGGRACWRAGRGGLKYMDRERYPDGIAALFLRRHGTRTLIKVKAKGERLPVPVLPLSATGNVTAQLVDSHGGCWQAEYAAGSAINDDGRFIGRSPRK